GLNVAPNRRLFGRVNVHVHEYPDPVVDRRGCLPIHTARDGMALEYVANLPGNIFTDTRYVHSLPPRPKTHPNHDRSGALAKRETVAFHVPRMARNSPNRCRIRGFTAGALVGAPITIYQSSTAGDLVTSGVAMRHDAGFPDEVLRQVGEHL